MITFVYTTLGIWTFVGSCVAVVLCYDIIRRR